MCSVRNALVSGLNSEVGNKNTNLNHPLGASFPCLSMLFAALLAVSCGTRALSWSWHTRAVEPELSALLKSKRMHSQSRVPLNAMFQRQTPSSRTIADQIVSRTPWHASNLAVRNHTWTNRSAYTVRAYTLPCQQATRYRI